MRLRIVKPVVEPEAPMRVLREKKNHQYQFFGINGFIGRSPCRDSVKKLEPRDVLNREKMCTSDYWRYCNLVDGKGNVLDTMSRRKALTLYFKGLYKDIALIPSMVPRIQGVSGCN